MQTVDLIPGYWWRCKVCNEESHGKGIPEHVVTVQCPHCESVFASEHPQPDVPGRLVPKLSDGRPENPPAAF